MDIDRIKDLIELLSGTDVSEVEWEAKDFKLKLKRDTGIAPAEGVASAGAGPTWSPLPAAGAPAAPHATLPGPILTPAPAMLAPAATAPAPLVTSEADLPESTRVVKAPLVGTFYRAPGAGTDPFTRVGAFVKKGDTLCIIESMKLMNEIESEVNGKIVAILVENEAAVEFNQILFQIEVQE